MPRALAVVVALLALLYADGSFACAVCANTNLAPRAEASNETPRLRLSLDTKIGAVRAGDTSLEDRRLELGLAFAPLRDLELSIAVPALHRTVHARGRQPERALVAGDVDLRATAVVFRANRGAAQTLVVSGGAKLPSAPNERDDLGHALSSILQPGCNAITPTLAVGYGLTNGRWGLAASASFLFPIAVRRAPHTAESLRTTVALSVTPTRWLTARSGFATRYEPSGELYPGIGDPHSGGFVGSLVEELVVTPHPRLDVGAVVYAPVLQALHGDQRVGSTFGATVAARF